MPVNQYLEVEKNRSALSNGRSYHRSYANTEQFSRGIVLERRIRSTWRFGHRKKWSDWFANEVKSSLPPQKIGVTWTIYPSHGDEIKTSELVRAIGSRLKIGKRNAEAMKDKLFDEIDRISETKKIGFVSEEEKDELVRAIIRTADDLLKKTLETRRSEG